MWKYIIIFLVCIPATSFALSSDKQQTAYLQADSATLNHKTGVGIYHGNVKLTQGSTTITATTLTTYLDQQDQLIKAIGIGTNFMPASYNTLPDNSKLPFNAVALTINYYPPRSLVEFIDRAKAVQGQDTYTGPQLNYAINQQIVTSPISTKGRTQIIIQPDQKES